MGTELARTAISAITALSGLVNAYRSRSESSNTPAEQEAATASPSSTDPWRWRAETVLIPADELDQIVAKAEASPEAGEALAALIPEEVLQEVLELPPGQDGRSLDRTKRVHGRSEARGVASLLPCRGVC